MFTDLEREWSYLKKFYNRKFYLLKSMCDGIKCNINLDFYFFLIFYIIAPNFKTMIDIFIPFF